MNWKIDSAHSRIEFSVRHMMISKVRGTFDRFDGTIDVDENDPEQADIRVEIDAASINTGVEDRDNHLRSQDFLYAEEYPTLTFESKRVERLDEKHARLVGDLTIRDITREVALDVEYIGQAKSPYGTVSAGFAADTALDRTDWGLTWNHPLETGGVLVGNKVEVHIELELIKQTEEETEAEPAAA